MPSWVERGPSLWGWGAQGQLGDGTGLMQEGWVSQVPPGGPILPGTGTPTDPLKAGT